MGTASLDTQRPVIWNISAIAASGRLGTLELIRKVILASAAIPGAFPPVMIDVEADDSHYQEMNVDGGVVAQVFLYPVDLGLRVDLRSQQYACERHTYIIRNSRLDPEWAFVNRRFLSISGRAIATMIHYSGYNDLLRIYATTQRDGIDYNLAYIEQDFPVVKHGKFDPAIGRSSTTPTPRDYVDLPGVRPRPILRLRGRPMSRDGSSLVVGQAVGSSIREHGSH
jgi:hypothetical protein